MRRRIAIQYHIFYQILVQIHFTEWHLYTKIYMGFLLLA